MSAPAMRPKVGWSFLRSGRWVGLFALGVVFAVACVLLSNWQFARRAEARLEIDRVANNWSAEPRPLADLVPDPSAFNEDDKWARAEVTGTYLAEDQLLVRNRPLAGDAGFEILTPLRTADGTVFIVDRGWIPTGERQNAPDSVPDPPEGQVTVVVHLKAAEPAIEDRSAPAGQVATVELPVIATMLDEPMYTGAYGLLSTETPTGETGTLAIKPEPDEGPHLSYALQWYVFAIMGFVGLGLLARQEYRIFNSDDPEEQERAAEREARRAARKTDADIEDEILDSVR